MSRVPNDTTLQVLQICSNHNLAPKLLAHKFHGRWCVTVSQYIEGDWIDVYLKKLGSRDECTALLNRLKGLMHKTLKIVHGDLRPPNILVERDTRHICIVDWDFAGKLEAAKYPLYLNPALDWPEDVVQAS